MLVTSASGATPNMTLVRSDQFRSPVTTLKSQVPISAESTAIRIRSSRSRRATSATARRCISVASCSRCSLSADSALRRSATSCSSCFCLSSSSRCRSKSRCRARCRDSNPTLVNTAIATKATSLTGRPNGTVESSCEFMKKRVPAAALERSPQGRMPRHRATPRG